uniref:Uncharacterized protein n=1 Tax=Lepeophtheirus salmonis TaxID=72036 RepID=A0A0K2UQ96_LEPSM
MCKIIEIMNFTLSSETLSRDSNWCSAHRICSMPTELDLEPFMNSCITIKDVIHCSPG